MVEQKKEYDHEVIEELRHAIMQYEYMTDEDINQLEGVDASKGFLNSSIEHDTVDPSLGFRVVLL
ncbi:unnamed protein product [Lupinus luteus]|uniref:Uncharacterized protein n=1 Tax=Lupinus luteus TaxID=3873 RepID=A0AAV1XWV5_LUPLU